MEEIFKFEHAENPKDAIRRLLEEGKQRREAMLESDKLEGGYMNSKKAEPAVTVRLYF